VQIRAATGHKRHSGADGLEHIGARFPRGDVHRRIEWRDGGEEVGCFARDGVVEFLREFGVGSAPFGVGLLPGGVGGREGRAVFFEIGFRLRRHKKGLLRQAERLAGFGHKFHARLAVGLVRATHFGDAFSNDRLGDDELRLSAGGGLRLGNGVGDFREIVAIDLLDIPAVGDIARGSVLALRHRRHRVERHIVGIINEDQIIETEVAGERAGFLRDAFLQTTVAGERDDMVVENPVRRRVETRLAHFSGNRKAHGVRHALPERAGGCLDAWRFVKLRMAGSDAMELAEIF